jgi:hypothetical protein
MLEYSWSCHSSSAEHWLPCGRLAQATFGRIDTFGTRNNTADLVFDVVLDRLLALQLGRPAAIHEEEYCVNVPSETDETACLFDEEAYRAPLDQRPSSIDYFISIIKFSKILSQVISDLYRPSQVAIEPDKMLLSTTTLDERLTEWKLSLPRHLRFDLGHTFEKSMIFKRQVKLDV